ncbi:PepSY domain-containing protein [Paracoccus sp. WLY502]|uniref:PepSY domain-containing protein n=1 Tax=Paracoccus yibinensis TaxID=3068891 RepID=UPI0027964652|nr:PepSY domain-containing protein [Paracoccus sp. WLY502]MDQ1899158.1 PepSY domain-containing protein [Paracoccus sp. WLY502]
MTIRMIALATLIAAPTALMAQETPPEGSMPLSQLVTKLEADLAGELGHITDVSWDDDGYWEVEYQNADNREVEIRVDPASGEMQQ